MLFCIIVADCQQDLFCLMDGQPQKFCYVVTEIEGITNYDTTRCPCTNTQVSPEYKSMAPKRGKQHQVFICILDLRERFTVDSDGKVLELKPHNVAVHPSNYI